MEQFTRSQWWFNSSLLFISEQAGIIEHMDKDAPNNPESDTSNTPDTPDNRAPSLAEPSNESATPPSQDAPSVELVSPPSQSETPEDSRSNSSLKSREKVWWGISALTVLVLIGAVLYYGSTQSWFQGAHIKHLDPQPSPPTGSSIVEQPTPTPSISPYAKSSWITLYTVENNAIVEVAGVGGKNIGDYYVRPLYNNDGKVFLTTNKNIIEYDLDSKQYRLVYEVKEPGFEILSANADRENLYSSIYDSKQSEFSWLADAYLDITKLTDASHRRLGPVKPAIYGFLDYGFPTTRNNEVIGTFGGDSCAGYGEYLLLEGDKHRKIVEVGDGCTNQPRNIGFIPSQDKLVLLSVVYEELSDDNPFHFQLDKLYTKNVYTGQEETLVDLKSMTSSRKSAHFIDEANHTLTIIFHDRQVWQIDWLNPTSINKQTLHPSIDPNHYAEYYGGKLYSVSIPQDWNAGKPFTFEIVDGKTGAKTSIPSPIQAANKNQFGHLGFWNGNPVLFSYDGAHDQY